MSFATVLVSVFILILATNGVQINPTQQQVLLDIYDSCSPNCPTQISSSAGSCDFNSTLANQCSCSTSAVRVQCNSNGDITYLSLYFTFYTITHKHKPKTKKKKKERKKERKKQQKTEQKKKKKKKKKARHRLNRHNTHSTWFIDFSSTIVCIFIFYLYIAHLIIIIFYS